MGEVAEIAARLAPILRDAPVRLAMLFGSVARGRARPESDLDVGFLPSRALSLSEELDLQALLSEAAGREVDLVRLDRADPLLAFEVARDGKVLFEGEEGARATFAAEAGIRYGDMQPVLEAAGRMFRSRVAKRAKRPEVA